MPIYAVSELYNTALLYHVEAPDEATALKTYKEKGVYIKAYEGDTESVDVVDDVTHAYDGIWNPDLYR